MKNICLRLEKFFEAWGRGVCRHRLKALLFMLAFTALLVSQLPQLRIDTNSESYFKESDRTLLDYNAFRDQFGQDELLIVGIEPPDIFDFPFLEKLERLHRDLEANVPYLADITSLVNARNTRGEGETLIVEGLLEKWPQTPHDLATLRERVLSNFLYADLLVSRDGTFTTIILKARPILDQTEADILAGFEEAKPDVPAQKKRYLGTEQKFAMVEAVQRVVAPYEAPDFRIHLGGMPVVDATLMTVLKEDLERLTPVSILASMGLLFLLFRRLSGVLYPILTVVLSILATMGTMAALGIPLTDIGNILPTFLLVVGIADSVHILSVFYQRYDRTDDKAEAMAYAMGHSGLAVLMTTLTTAGGLLAFIAADAAPIADLGIIAPLGVLFAFVYTVVLLPALISLLPVRRKRVRHEEPGRFDRLLSAVARISCGHPGKVLVVSAAVLAIAVAGAAQVRFSHNALNWLPDELPARQATALMDEKLRGTVTLEAIIDTGSSGGLYDPEFLRLLEATAAHALTFESGDVWIGKAWSVDTILKEIHRALNENRPEFYVIPDSRELIAQEFLLFEGSGSDDLEEVIDRDFRAVRLTMKLPFGDLFHYRRLQNELNSYFANTFPDAKVTVTGVAALFAHMVETAITSMVHSYLISLAVITLLMIVLIGRVRIGMLSMIPNLFPLIVLVGFMGWTGIPFDLSTTIIGSIVIALVVDDTIHFMHSFRRYFERSGNVAQAVEQTLHTTGRAILVTSIVLISGFATCLMSDMSSTQTFGMLMGLAVTFALVADFFVVPALMTLVHRGKSVPAIEPSPAFGGVE